MKVEEIDGRQLQDAKFYRPAMPCLPGERVMIIAVSGPEGAQAGSMEQAAEAKFKALGLPSFQDRVDP